MEVFVDDTPVNADSFREGTVEDALRHVQANRCAPGHLVVGLRLDGKDVPTHAMTDTLRRPASSFDRLEVFTGRKAILVADAMAHASACLTETESACQRAAELLTEGKIVEASEGLADCLRTWQQIHDAIGKSIEMLQLDVEQTTVNEEPLLALIRKPAEVLLEVKDALKSRDHVLLADILQYEFSEVTSCWHSIIAKLRAEAEDVEASGGP